MITQKKLYICFFALFTIKSNELIHVFITHIIFLRLNNLINENESSVTTFLL